MVCQPCWRSQFSAGPAGWSPRSGAWPVINGPSPQSAQAASMTWPWGWQITQWRASMMASPSRCSHMIAISSRCARISVRPAVGRDDRGHDRGVGDAGRAELGEPFRPRAKDGSRVIPQVIVGRGDRDSHDRASGGEPDGELREAALAWAQQLAKGPDLRARGDQTAAAVRARPRLPASGPVPSRRRA